MENSSGNAGKEVTFTSHRKPQSCGVLGCRYALYRKQRQIRILVNKKKLIEAINHRQPASSIPRDCLRYSATVSQSTYDANKAFKARRYDQTTCSVCLESLNHDGDSSVDDCVRTLTCGHRFHQNCIDNWFKRSIACPYCRTPNFTKSISCILIVKLPLK